MPGPRAAFLLAGCLSAFAVGARAQDYARFTASSARTPTEKLVLCDTTAFLATQPDIEADRILVRLQGRSWVHLQAPYFVQGGLLYGAGDEQLFDRMRARGETSREQLASVQAVLGRGLIDAYRPMHSLPGSFVRDQLGFCHRFARSYGVNSSW